MSREGLSRSVASAVPSALAGLTSVFGHQKGTVLSYVVLNPAHVHGPADRNFDEKMFSGPVHLQIRRALEFLRSSLLLEKVLKISGKAEAIRVWNYPYEALEEAVVNAVYHRNYQEHEPITIRIEQNRIIIYNLGGPDRSLKLEDLRKGNAVPKRYRNRRLGDFLKEIDLTEGRATGLALIRDRLEKNGSPALDIETDEERTWFQITLFQHPAFKEIVKKEKLEEDNLIIALKMAIKNSTRVDCVFRSKLPGVPEHLFIRGDWEIFKLRVPLLCAEAGRLPKIPP